MLLSILFYLTLIHVETINILFNKEIELYLIYEANKYFIFFFLIIFFFFFKLKRIVSFQF